MGRLMIMGKGTGHETVDLDTPKAVRQAEEILRRELKKGGTAFAVDTATGKTNSTTTIDSEVDTHIVLPLRGG